jgi:protein-L-isoaspartate(D-aspartate) O-methyltransferase
VFEQMYRRLAPFLSCPEHAPYDRIIVTAATDLAPPVLLQRLKPGCGVVLPAGLGRGSEADGGEKNAAGRARIRELMPVQFGLLETVP